jgi:hypothetical protein
VVKLDINMKEDTNSLTKCYFRDDEFSLYFLALRSAEIQDTKTATILRQIFAEIMLGNGQAESGFKNPHSLTGKFNAGDAWTRFGLYNISNSIAKTAALRKAKISELKAWGKALQGKRLVRGSFIAKAKLNSLARRFERGSWDENQERLLSYNGSKVHRIGRAYFVESTGYGWTPGSLWVE